VVVLAHDRRQYLKGAVASIVGQDLERSEFEIIVVKNFLDPAIDEYLAEVHADSIL
jgi:glycosyltransferase involved in cell wall biosynthesis